MTQPTPAVPSATDALTAAMNKLLKPGSKTSEFVMLVAVYGGGLATLLGAFNTSSPRFNAVLKVAALVAASASQIGYSLSRGNAKAALSSLAQSLVSFGVVFPVSSGRHSAPARVDAPADAGAVDLVGLVAGVLTLAGLIWLVVGFTHHRLDVFGLVLLIVGVGIYFLLDGPARTRFTRRP